MSCALVFALVFSARQTKHLVWLFANVTVFALSYASTGRQLFSAADKLKLRTVSSKLFGKIIPNNTVNPCQLMTSLRYFVKFPGCFLTKYVLAVVPVLLTLS